MAQRFSLSLVSLVALAACTQPAVMVEDRGSQQFNRGASTSSYAMAAPVQSITQSSTPSSYVGSKPVYNASREQDEKAAISVNDLQPAAGGSNTTVASKEVVINGQKTPAYMPFGKPTPPPASDTTISEVKPVVASETKPVVLSSDSSPVNPWTNKPRGDVAANTITQQPTAAAADAQYIWPVSSHDVTSSFGNKGGGKANDGINIAAGEGEPVWAAADGEVVYADKKMKGYGNMVIVKHAGGKTTTYAHLARMGVEKYDRVSQGDIIGYVGTTGNVKSPQLYFSMRDGTNAIDPQKYLDRKVAGL